MYKIFEGETLQQALLKMKIELGPDAILVEHKMVKRGGFLGLFSKNIFIVKALPANVIKGQSILSNETPKSTITENQKEKFIKKISSTIKEKNIQLEKENKVLEKPKVNHIINEEIKLSEPEPKIKEPPKIYSPYTQVKKTLITDTQKNIKNERQSQQINKQIPDNIQEKQVLKKVPIAKTDKTDELAEEIKILKDELKNISGTIGIVLEKVQQEEIKYPGLLTKYYMYLMENEFEEECADKIIKRIEEQLPKKDLNNPIIIDKIIKNEIEKILIKKEHINFNTDELKIFVVVGPTGVGKTTTLAKLGAYLSLEEKKEIAFLTLDTYRLAAVEQLRKYAQALNTPLKVIFMPEEINEGIMSFLNRDIILVDTAGRSPTDKVQMQELFDFVKHSKFKMDIALVLSATTKYSDLEEIIEKFGPIKFNQFIITKIDETISLGPLISLVDKYKVPISYITDGQDVPDNFSFFEPKKFIEILFKNFKINISEEIKNL
ncbi:MAG TPA: 50S ribosome-binding GTPase [bacterium]|nr:50S ribosome-binding GTPase [bacterium]HPQ18246.1 50S ribosome-binding GTPase [bacterium]